MSKRWQDALPKRVAFALSGGASQAALQLGMLRVLCDAGLIAYVPLQGALMLEAASIVALDAGELCSRSEPPTNIPEIVVSTVHAAIRQRVHAEAPAVAQKVPLLYLPTPCAHDHHFLDFRDSSRLMAEADIPKAGRMSGAPHTHEG